MFKFTSETTVRCSPGEAFAFLTELEKFPLWQKGVVASTVLDPGPVRVGTRFEETVDMPIGRMQPQCRVIGLAPGQSLEIRAESKVLDCQGLYELHPAGKDTRIRFTGFAKMKGFWRLLEPMMAAGVRKEVPAELERLRGCLEKAG